MSRFRKHPFNAPAEIRAVFTYLNEHFAVPRNASSLELQKQAELVLGNVGDAVEGEASYTFTILWVDDGLDSCDNLDVAIALATSQANEKNSLAEVRVSRWDYDPMEDEEDEWDDVTIYAIGPDLDELEKLVYREQAPVTNPKRRGGPRRRR